MDNLCELDVKGLADLLCPEDMIEESTLPPSITPASIGTSGKNEIAPPNVKIHAKTKLREKREEEEKKKKKDKKDKIWDEENIKESVVICPNIKEKREKPLYEIQYLQRVGVEDTIFGLNENNPSSDCCNEYLIIVYLNNTNNINDISLDVFNDRMIVQTSKYYLNLSFPNPVYKDKGSAKFVKDKEQLRVVVPIDRRDE
eukprot:GHVR01076320.1.p1 GENE.GHVR01076320.1~~GHVR01076320.1.p1  ORF type:complete len:200 (+),score=55.90 GHVR01076320.1:71-670(+)